MITSSPARSGLSGQAAQHDSYVTSRLNDRAACWTHWRPPGFAERGRHPTGRRATGVSLTAKGRRKDGNPGQGVPRRLNRVLEGISDQDPAAFVSVACTVMDRIRTINC